MSEYLHDISDFSALSEKQEKVNFDNVYFRLMALASIAWTDQCLYIYRHKHIGCDPESVLYVSRLLWLECMESTSGKHWHIARDYRHCSNHAQISRPSVWACPSSVCLFVCYVKSVRDWDLLTWLTLGTTHLHHCPITSHAPRVIDQPYSPT